MWLKVFVVVVATYSLSVHVIAAEGPSCSIFIHGATSTSSSQSDKYPKANPVLKREGYALLYDGRSKTALWVYEELTRNSLIGDVDRDQFHFTEDPDIPEIIRSTPEDYAYSGYNGGHLAPAGDHKASEIQMEQTFYLSNVSPQLAGFNRGYWKKFEIYVRKLTDEYDTVRVVTGPPYLPHEASDGKKHITLKSIFIL